MNAMLMSSENSKISNFIDYYSMFQIKKSQREVINMLLYQISAYNTKTTKLKYLGQRGMKNLNYLMYQTLYQIFNIILSIALKNIKY